MRRRARSARVAPVEALSRPAWERVEAGVFERMNRGEHLQPTESARASGIRAYARIAAPAVAAACLLGWWGWHPSAHEVAAAGRTSSDAVETTVSTEAPTDTHIVTTRAPARTTFGGGALTLAQDSEVHVSGSDRHGWLVLLDRGEIDCEVMPRHGRPPFVVQAGETRVSVVGTQFSVSRDKSHVRVSVRSGLVRVSSGFEQQTLGPGEFWPSAPAEIVPQADQKTHAMDAARLFEKASRLEPDRPRAALAIYRRLSSRKGPWAANALYAEARLEHERGRSKRAETLLRRYLKRHPGAPNRQDVDALLARISEPH